MHFGLVRYLWGIMLVIRFGELGKVPRKREV